MLLIEWCNFIHQLDPDILVGYNIFGYDYQYIFERAMYLGIVANICSLSRIKTPLQSWELKILQQYAFTKQITDPKHERVLNKIYIKQNTFSAGSGSNSLKYINTIGRINLDLLKYCRENGDNLSSYKLDAVAKHYGLSKGKNDMPYKEIFRIFRNGTSKEKSKVAEYCVQDCWLCSELLTKLNVISNCIGMCSTCIVPFNYLLIRGQGIRIYSLLLKECYEMNFVVPTKKTVQGSQSYTGATVLHAQSGFYACPVSVLDFASLYPSCIISHNLCSSTKLTKEQLEMKMDYTTCNK